MLAVRICMGRPHFGHGMSVSVGEFGRIPFSSSGGRQLLAEVLVEVAEDLLPLLGADGDLVEGFFEPGGEPVVEQVAEVLDESLGHDLAHLLGVEAAVVEPHVAPVLYRRDDRRVGRRPADAALLELLDEARLAVARRRLGEVLLRIELLELEVVADLHVGQRPSQAFLPEVG